MKRAIFFFVLALLTAPRTSAADEGWIITSFASDVTIRENGIVSVAETIAVDFAGIEKHGIFRDLPAVYANEDGSYRYTKVEVMEVRRDGEDEPYELISNDAHMRIKIGDSDVTISGPHTYRIVYEATGVLRAFDEYDEFYWNVTGNGWPVPIAQSSAAVTLPREGMVQTSCYTGYYGSADPCEESSSTAARASFSHGELLESGEGLTIAVGYAKGMVPILTVAAPKTIGELIRTSPLPLGTLAALFAGGLTLILRAWWRKGRDRFRGHRSAFNPDMPESAMPIGAHEPIIAEYESPEGLRPAEVGLLMDETADTLDVSATVVDLAVRGYIEIKEIPKAGWFGSADYEFTRREPDPARTMDVVTRTGAPLLSYERSLLDSLFTSGFSSGGAVKLSSLKMKFHAELAEIKDKLYKTAVEKKLFASDPRSARLRHGLLAGLLLFLGFPALFLSFPPAFGDTARSILFGFGGALLPLGFIYIGVAIYAMPQRTAHGRELYRKARGYREYIEHAEKYRQRFFERENTFMEALPYAMVFGATKKLARAMEAMGVTPPAPSWYHGAQAFNAAVFSDSLSSFSSSLSSTMASSPSSSGSGGGGFSGGGGGGGGGGSW